MSFYCEGTKYSFRLPGVIFIAEVLEVGDQELRVKVATSEGGIEQIIARAQVIQARMDVTEKGR